MEKAIEIKRRAQRCIQNGDLDGALTEYEKLVGSEETDPYNYVLLADLLYKKGDHADAAERYLSAVAAYEKASLFKNAIAVCKKMMRLSLSPAKVLYSLAGLHALDGLSGEAALYYVQYAEHMVRSNSPEDAAKALRRAFDVSQENLRVLEQLSEAWLLAGNEAAAAEAMLEASSHYRARGAETEAERCAERAAALSARAGGVAPAASGPPAASATFAIEPGTRALDAPAFADAAAAALDAGRAAEPVGHGRLEGFESGRREAPSAAPALEEPEAPAAQPVESELRPAPVLSSPGSPVSPAEFVDETSAEPESEAASAEGVYEIDADESAGAWETEAALAAGSGPTPDAPSLSFANAAPAPAPSEDAAQRVEQMLARAQESFRAGQREEASRTLAEAAQVYESLGRLENAATIYRSLGRGAYATPGIMELWLGNCERRGDASEAAQVACDLGDRALNDGDEAAARGWFERALVLDHTNETAQRRLQRLGRSSGSPGGIAVATEARPQPADAPTTEGRVEVAVGRAEAVTFDLAGLLAEFQRGVEQQLAGDAQSHYDLGMAYREMGLLEQSVDSFRVAQDDPAFIGRASEMIGRCFADQGRWAEAAGEYRKALISLVDEADGVALRYHFGGALAELGEPEEALEQYEMVAQHVPGFEDVDERILALRRVLGRT